MSGQSSIGQPGALLGKLILGLLPGQSPSFGFMAHVLDSTTIRVVFEVPVDGSALNPNSYSLLPVLGIPQIFVPGVISVKFFDGDMTSVSVSLSAPLTFSAIYSIQLRNIVSVDGRISSTSTYNLTASVPNPPFAIGAYLSDRSCLDVVFDKSVRDTSTIVSAQIFPIFQGNTLLPSVLTRIVGTNPETNIRFEIPPGLLTGDSFLIQYLNVTDSSFNTASSGEVFLDVRLQSPPPWSYSDISTPAVVSAYVSRVVPTEYNAYVNVFFSCPMLDTDIVDVSKWSVTKDGVHLLGISSPVTAPDPTNDASLINICVDLKTKFNAHLIAPDVHFTSVNSLPFSTSVIGLLNDLLEKYNSHAVLVPSHSFPDRDDTVQLKPAFSVEQAIVLSIALKTKYNTHLGALYGSTPYHSVDDTENVVTSPDPSGPSDILGASVIADELRTRLLMHELGQWHSVHDTTNSPSSPYSNPSCVFPSITTVNESISLLNELQQKYATHLLSGSIHLYQDDVNNITPQTVTDEPVAMTVATEMKQSFNGHILYDFPVDVDSVVSFSGSISSALVSDSFTYMARLKLNGSSSVPRYTIVAGLNSQDIVYTLFNFRTDSFGVTNDMSVKSYTSFLTVRTSSGLSLPKYEDVFVEMDGGSPVNVNSISLDSSIQTIQELIAEMMDVFRIHLSESGLSTSGQAVIVHDLTDIDDYFDDSRIPDMDEVSVVTAVNFLKSVYNKHVSDADGKYHVFQASTDFVSRQNATDFRSAINLAIDLNTALLNHRNNLSSHRGKGPRLQFAKEFDSITMCYDGLMRGADYIIEANLKILPNDPRSFSHPVTRKITESFRGLSSSPFVASALPEPGAGRGSSNDELIKDQLNIFFSKPMNEEPVPSSFLIFTGPPGLIVGESYWDDSRVLRVQVSGMEDYLQYGLDVSLLKDSFGNPI